MKRRSILPDGPPNVGTVADWIHDREARGINDNVTTDIHYSVERIEYDNPQTDDFSSYSKGYTDGFLDGVRGCQKVIRTDRIPYVRDTIYQGRVAFEWDLKKWYFQSFYDELKEIEEGKKKK